MADLKPFATVEDYIARYGEPSPDEADRLDALLLDATAYIQSEMPLYKPGQDEVMDANVKAVTCSVVWRVVSRPLEGISQVQQTVGPYTQGLSFANADGAMYLTRSEQSKLGTNTAFVGTVQIGR